VVDGQVHHFGARGLYNAGLLLGDRETGSFWQHLTSTCVHGPLAGRRLEAFPITHMMAGQALRIYPHTRVVVSQPSFKQWMVVRCQEAVLTLLGNHLPPGFARTMGEEDPRRPRMERGLAVWTDRVQRFYPLDALRGGGNALFDELDGRRLLVYIDPATGKPACLRTCATGRAWRDDMLWLDTSETVRGGVLCDAQGTPQGGDRPMHSVACWYGFAFSFPGGEIYEGHPT
jgi:hypothetical protein